MKDLTVEAKCMSVIFGFMGKVHLTELRFDRPHILTKKARKGLDDLVEAGLLRVDTDGDGGMSWYPVDMEAPWPKVSQAFVRRENFPLTVE